MEDEGQDQVETRIRLNSEEEWEAKELKEKEKLLFQVQETENQENYRYNQENYRYNQENYRYN